MVQLEEFSFSTAVEYHYDQFPPTEIDFGSLVEQLMATSEAIARYDQMLLTLHNGEILLSPLRSQEAVVSSRMEGTISTLDEILRYEAEVENEASDETNRFRSEIVEVALFNRAMKFAQRSMEEGQPLSPFLIRSAHRMLLSFGRGANKNPGEFKTDQNYIADRRKREILFVPIKPELLNGGMDNLFSYMADSTHEMITRSIVSHVEFEALHPFDDGNGRIGRMIVPLMLWSGRKISAPYFYVSSYLEQNKDEYVDRMRLVSSNGDWTGWVRFMLEAYEAQAKENLQKAQHIQKLYDEMKERFREMLQSQWSIVAADFMFTNPVFKASSFAAKSGIPSQTAYRFLKQFQKLGMITTVQEAAGRRSAIYSFEPLLDLVRE